MGAGVEGMIADWQRQGCIRDSCGRESEGIFRPRVANGVASANANVCTWWKRTCGHERSAPLGGAAQQRVSGACGELQKSTARRTHNAQGVADF
jgi:hypothetical protein